MSDIDLTKLNPSELKRYIRTGYYAPTLKDLGHLETPLNFNVNNFLNGVGEFTIPTTGNSETIVTSGATLIFENGILKIVELTGATPTTTAYVPTTTSYVPTTTVAPVNNTYLVDFGVTNAGYITDVPAIDGAYWNNFAYGTVALDYNLTSGQTLINLVTNSGTTSNLSIEIASDNWVSLSAGGGNADLSGKSISGNIYPRSSIVDSINIANPYTGVIKIHGCDNSKYYTIGVFSSKYNEDINNFTVQGVEKAINPHGPYPGNDTLTIWNNVVPVDGVITILANQPTAGGFAWLELLEIVETSSPL